jgi:hypothetical protein
MMMTNLKAHAIGCAGTFDGNFYEDEDVSTDKEVRTHLSLFSHKFSHSFNETFTKVSHSQEEQYRAKPAIRLFIPDILKAILVDDWEQITSKNNFVVLPSKTPIEMILDDYNSYCKQQAGYVYSDLFEESLKGLKAYADIAIPRRLLYRQERRIENGVESQYLHIYKRMHAEGDELHGKRIHQVFGCEHFLRQLSELSVLPNTYFVQH